MVWVYAAHLDGLWNRILWEMLAFEYVKTSVDKNNKFRKMKSMQHVLVAVQQEKSFSYSILIFVISLFGCPPAFNPRGRRPICIPLHATGWGRGWGEFCKIL